MQQHCGGNVARASALLLQMLAAQERHEQQLAKIVSRLENEPSLKSEQQMNRLEADEISALRTELVVPPARATRTETRPQKWPTMRPENPWSARRQRCGRGHLSAATRGSSQAVGPVARGMRRRRQWL